ncbi:MAG: GGDEF domain-containing protein [Colwellia sp.]|nr:GGDEF domain-containing protein [Colwellia sp.]
MNTGVMIASLVAISFFWSSCGQTNENKAVTLEQAIEYSIKTKILTLLTLSTENPNKADTMLAKSLLEFKQINIGEQYLLLLAKANIAQSNKQHQQVISLLEQAQLLQDNIAEKQLTSPLFANFYQVLAISLAATKNYQKAYQVKQDFVDGYNDYSDAQRDNIVKQLTEKHEIIHKIESNKLLDKRNELKAIRLDDVEKQQVILQRNIILILCTIFVFMLLFLRQLQVRKKLILITKTDSLTGLINRTALFTEGDQLIKIATEQELDLSVLLFNIDHFKAINDNFGHHVGDLVLAKVAQLVSETMRSRDIFSRIGGKEFIAILPSTDIDKAKAIAMRVMEKITFYDFSELGVDSNITLSLGVANNLDTKAIFDELLHAADLAMYQAKAQGRNQMVSYSAIVKDKERRKG